MSVCGDSVGLKLHKQLPDYSTILWKDFDSVWNTVYSVYNKVALVLCSLNGTRAIIINKNGNLSLNRDIKEISHKIILESECPGHFSATFTSH